MNMKKAKFAGLNFGSAEVLLKDAQKNVKGGAAYGVTCYMSTGYVCAGGGPLCYPTFTTLAACEPVAASKCGYCMKVTFCY
jgi:hypothetical protein